MEQYSHTLQTTPLKSYIESSKAELAKADLPRTLEDFVLYMNLLGSEELEGDKDFALGDT